LVLVPLAVMVVFSLAVVAGHEVLSTVALVVPLVVLVMSFFPLPFHRRVCSRVRLVAQLDRRGGRIRYDVAQTIVTIQLVPGLTPPSY
jgi:hypothetical protein